LLDKDFNARDPVHVPGQPFSASLGIARRPARAYVSIVIKRTGCLPVTNLPT
jgi:hypothetical protein